MEQPNSKLYNQIRSIMEQVPPSQRARVVDHIKQAISSREPPPLVEKHETPKALAALAHAGLNKLYEYSPRNPRFEENVSRFTEQTLPAIKEKVKSTISSYTDPETPTLAKLWTASQIIPKAFELFAPGGLFLQYLERAEKQNVPFSDLMKEVARRDPTGLVFLGLDALPVGVGSLVGYGAHQLQNTAGKLRKLVKPVSTVDELAKQVALKPAARQTYHDIAQQIVKAAKDKLTSPDSVPIDVVPILTKPELTEVLKAAHEGVKDTSGLVNYIAERVAERSSQAWNAAFQSGRSVYHEALELGAKRANKPGVWEGWTDLPKPVEQKWKRRLVDIHADPNQLYHDLLKSGRLLPGNKLDLEIDIASTWGRMAEHTATKHTELILPLKNQIARIAQEFGVAPPKVMDDLGVLAYATHAQERNIAKAGRASPDMAFGSGMSPSMAQTAIEAISKARGKDYLKALQEARNILDQITNATLEIRAKMQNLPVEKLKALYPHYVPLSGKAGRDWDDFLSSILDESDIAFAQAKAKDVVGTALTPSTAGIVREAGGRFTLTADNPVITALDNLFRVIRAYEKNQLSERFRQVALGHPDPRVWKVLRPEEVRTLKKQRKTGELAPNEIRIFKPNPKTRLGVEEWRIAFTPEYLSVAKALRTAGFDSLQVGIRLYGWLKDWSRVLGTALTTKPNASKLEKWFGTNLTKVSEKLPEKTIDPITKLSQRAAANLTARDPFFPIRNYVKDFQFALGTIMGDVNSKAATKRFLSHFMRPAIFRGIRGPGGSIIKDGAFKGKTWHDVYKAYLQNGGVAYSATHVINPGTHYQEFLKSALPRQRGLFKAIGDAVGKLNDAAEMMTKLATFETLCTMGINQRTAAHFAANAGVNFAKRGSWSRFMNSLYWFSSVNLQSGLRWMKDFAVNPTFRQYCVDLLAGSFAYYATLRMVLGRDDLTGLSPLDLQTPQQKLQTFTYPLQALVGDTPGKVPLGRVWVGFGPIQFFHGLGRLLSDFAFSEGLNETSFPEVLGGALNLFISSFTPFDIDPVTGHSNNPYVQLLPSPVQTALGPVTNQDTWGRSIVSEGSYTRGYPDVLKHRHTGSVSIYTDAARLIQEVINLLPISAKEKSELGISPDMIRWVVQVPFITPGWFVQTLNFTNYLRQQWAGDPEGKARFPLLSMFGPSNTRDSVNVMFWKLVDEMTLYLAQLSGMRASHDPNLPQYQSEESKMLSFARRLNVVASWLRIQERRLRNPDLSDSERKRIITQIRERQLSVVKEGNDLLIKAKKSQEVAVPPPPRISLSG